MRNKWLCLVLFFAVLGMVGCETLPKKFIRKKKTPAHTPTAVYLQDSGEYQKQFSNEYYYKNHYTLWKSWHEDIADNLGGNAKKLKRSADEAFSHLDQMANYLQPQKREALLPLIQELALYRDKITKGSYSKTEALSMRTDLDRIRRLVANDFYFTKVKNDLLPDKVDLGQ